MVEVIDTSRIGLWTNDRSEFYYTRRIRLSKDGGRSFEPSTSIQPFPESAPWVLLMRIQDGSIKTGHSAQPRTEAKLA